MNFLEYSVLAAAAVLVVFAQQSDSDNVKAFKDELDDYLIGNEKERETIRFINQRSRENEVAMVFVEITIDLRQGIINSTQQVARAEKIMIDGIKLAQSYLQNKEVAKQILLETFEKARKELYQCGLPSYLELGKALGLTNDGARSGLLAASKTLQRIGPATLDGLNNADSFAIDGIDAGGKAVPVLLLATSLAVDSVFVGIYKQIQDAMELACQALRNAKRNPMFVHTENLNCNTAKNDREASDAINEINNAADNALTNGAYPQLVQKFKQIIISSLGDIVIITDQCKRIVENFKRIAPIDPLDAKITYFKQTEIIKNGIHDVIAKMILSFGEVAPQSDNQSNNKIEAAISAVEEGFIGAFLGVDSAEDLIVNGMRCGVDDVIDLAVEAAAKIVFYGKIAFIKGIVKAAKQVFSVL